MNQFLKILVLGLCTTIVGCNQTPSLEKYFVTNSEKPNFVSIDMAPSMLDTKKLNLTPDQQLAMKGFDKMNVLIFKKTDKNIAEFDSERKVLNEILKNDKYQDLIRFSIGKQGATLSYVGNDNKVSEIIVSGNKTDVGLAVVRITGKDMNPNNILKMVSVLQNQNMDFKVFQPIFDALK